MPLGAPRPHICSEATRIILQAISLQGSQAIYATTNAGPTLFTARIFAYKGSWRLRRLGGIMLRNLQVLGPGHSVEDVLAGRGIEMKRKHQDRLGNGLPLHLGKCFPRPRINGCFPEGGVQGRGCFPERGRAKKQHRPPPANQRLKLALFDRALGLR